MFEEHRQQYLGALGIDSYFPRWVLPNCPTMRTAEFAHQTEITDQYQSVDLHAINQADVSSHLSAIIDVRPSPQFDLNKILVEKTASVANDSPTITGAGAPAPISFNAASILAQLDTPKPKKIAPFSLSIWRVNGEILVIDSRNAKAAMPTDALLESLLNYVDFKDVSLMEEKLQWPMIENRFAAQTEDEARQELQTWLSVQLEIHGFKEVWLMGKNAYNYFFEPKAMPEEFQRTSFPSATMPILIMPSLIELLVAPALKARLLPILKKR